MFVDRTVPSIGREWERFTFVKQMIGDACALMQRAIDAGVFPPQTNPLVAFHLLWAAVHGPATIAICQRLAPGEDPDALARDTLEAALTGLRAGITTTFTPCECGPEGPTNGSANGTGDEHA
jgi:hypothetical protein